MRIAVVGAGSAQFLFELAELCALPDVGPYEVALCDTDPNRLQVAEAFGRRAAEQMGSPATISSHDDRCRALDEADYVVVSIGVGMQESIRIDFEVCERHGLRQTVADTCGVGATVRLLRTAPALEAIARDMAEVCAGAPLLNVTNPMAMCCMALHRLVPEVTTIGLCHSTWITAAEIARHLDVPVNELEWAGAGVNHQVFISRLEHHGIDLYPRFRDMARGDSDFARTVRADLMRRLGHYVTESSKHNSEYLPWYLPWDDQVERFALPTSPYLERRSTNEQLIAMGADFAHGQIELPLADMLPTGEYAPSIIRSRVSGASRDIYVNVPNTTADGSLLVEELQADGVVEVPASCDGDGVHPRRAEPVPPQCAAINRRYLDVCDLAVRAIVEGRRDHVHHAALLDPNASASMSAERIAAMVDELLDAHQAAGRLPEALSR
ncbi:MAG TPA: hypothetical protein VJM33_19105 [Microthrixaceae bacterium]|nr:hypothetical protein [Microthrixaceae bacterium]